MRLVVIDCICQSRRSKVSVNVTDVIQASNMVMSTKRGFDTKTDSLTVRLVYTRIIPKVRSPMFKNIK
jgi:hypothetical protein